MYSNPDKSKAIGDRLRARRLMLGFSLEDVASRLDVSPQQVHKDETAQTKKLAVLRLLQYADALQCPVGYFVEDFHTEVELPTELTRALASPRALRALSLFCELEPHLQAATIDLMTAMAQSQEAPGDDSETRDVAQLVVNLRSRGE